MQNELKEKNEEILRLTSINDELLKDCKLDITFEMFAEEPATDIKELERLQKENQEMKSKLNDYDETTKEIQSKINALEKEKSNLNKNHEDELKNKDDRIKGLENEINNKVNEINSKANDIKKLKETEKKLKKEISEFDSKMQSKQSVIDKLEVEKNNMKNEIKTLIVQCKTFENESRQKDLAIKQQQQNLEVIQYELSVKNSDIERLEDQCNRLSSTLKDKRIMLNNAHLRIRELERNVVTNLKNNISDKDRTILLLKEVLKGHHIELTAKNKDIIRLKRALSRTKPNNLQNKTEHKGFNIKVVHPADVIEDSLPMETEERPEMESPEIDNAKSKLNGSVPRYKEIYMNQLNDYFKSICRGNKKNDSYNVRNALHYNKYLPDSRNTGINAHSMSVKLRSGPNKSNQYVTLPTNNEYDVSDIIRSAFMKKDPEHTMQFSSNLSNLLDNNKSPYGYNNKKITKHLLFT